MARHRAYSPELCPIPGPAMRRLLCYSTSLTARWASPSVHTRRVSAATTAGARGWNWQRAVLAVLAVQLVRESPRLVRGLANAQVLALGCTGARARRCGCWRASTAAMMRALVVSSPKPGAGPSVCGCSSARESAARRQPSRTLRRATSAAKRVYGLFQLERRAPSRLTSGDHDCHAGGSAN